MSNDPPVSGADATIPGSPSAGDQEAGRGAGVDPGGSWPPGGGRWRGRGGEVELGQLLRDAQRAYARALAARIAIYGVPLGHWHFLRVLWEEDGLTQRELSQRVGMMEPTTVNALRSMERRGLVRRIRNVQDRRKVNISLTPHAQSMKQVLLACAADVARDSLDGLDPRDLETAVAVLSRILANLAPEGPYGEGDPFADDGDGDVGDVGEVGEGHDGDGGDGDIDPDTDLPLGDPSLRRPPGRTVYNRIGVAEDAPAPPVPDASAPAPNPAPDPKGAPDNPGGQPKAGRKP